MRDPGAIFDRAGTVRRPPARRLLNEGWSYVAYRPAPPDPAGLPHGNGLVVLVVPAFLTNDSFTTPLRAFLRRCGFQPFGWQLGVNWGPTPQLLAGLRRRLTALCRAQAGPIGVIGLSLGGLLARDLAHDRPEAIRHVVTLASPSRLPTASTAELLVRACMHRYSPDIQVARLAQPLPVPTTTIYTRDDGIVASESCRGSGVNEVVLEVGGSHTTIGRNPEVLRPIVERLAASAIVRGP
jgi:hypothetical protein